MTLNFELGTLNVFENAAALERLKPLEHLEPPLFHVMRRRSGLQGVPSDPVDLMDDISYRIVEENRN